MAVLPGSLDYLYYNGILDHIPYEAYELPVYNNTQSGMPQMNGSQYLQAAQNGYMYQYDGRDSFVSSSGTSYGYNSNNLSGGVLTNANGVYGANTINGNRSVNADGSKSFRQSLLDIASSTKENFSSAPTYVKGLLALGTIGLTMFCLFKGKKKPVTPYVVNSKTSLLSKMNPLNWFRK